MRIDKRFTAGIGRGLAYYACGFALVWLTYLVFGWEYAHAPGLHHLVGLLVLVIGAVLFIRRLIGTFIQPECRLNKGALLTHALALLGFILFFKLSILNGAIKRDTGEPVTPKNLPVSTSAQAVLLRNQTADALLYQIPS